MKLQLEVLLLSSFLLGSSGQAQIKVNPTGVNVNSNGPTTVFLTFGRLANQVPVEAFWCGEIVNAAPDIGFKCDQSSLFGSLPIRYDLSRINADGSFTDIMSIPASVARRAYQAAQQGASSQFFYVRRFVSTTGGPDEYVAVTCRLAGGGARVPFSLLDVKITADMETPVLFVKKGEVPPGIVAEIYYNGTGQLHGRWEVVLPGDEPPAARDLLTEATLPIQERGSQRRYTEVSRFNIFLPPTGKVILPGPESKRIPTTLDGLHMLLLRIEATDDKEGDSDVGSISGQGGVVHSGAVAGFPLPPFRYFVGSTESETLIAQQGKLQLILPAENAEVQPETPIDFNWIEDDRAAVYKLEVMDSQNQVVLSALLQTGIGLYRAPSWLKDKAPGGPLTWRVTGLNFAGDEIITSDWRRLKIKQAN